MASILEQLQNHELRQFAAGESVIEQGGDTRRMLVLVEGSVEVVKDGVRVAVSSLPGVVFGELSALLGIPHTATVRAVEPSTFRIVEDPRAFLLASPEACMHVCELLARRLDSLNKYLVDVKEQFEGHDHIGMVDQVLETLLHRQPRQRIRPKESTIRHGEVAD